MSEGPENGGTISITAHSEPFHADPPYASGFYEAIGRVVVLWGRFEQQLDIHLRIAINIAALSGTEMQMQISLRRKTEALKKVYRAIPSLNPHAEAMVEFTKDVEKISLDRNLLIHSNYSSFEDGDPPKLIVQHLT